MGSFNGNIGTPSEYFNLLVEYSVSQSVDGNYSDVSATGYLKRNNTRAWPYNYYGGDANLSIDGNNAYAKVPYDLRNQDDYIAIISHSKRVEHNSDGTKGITISFSFNGNLDTYYPNGSVSQYITLPTIPRASGVSCTSPYIGDNGTIIIDRKSSNFTSTVWIVFGNVSQTIATKTSDVSLPFRTNDIKSQLYAQIPNSKSGVGTVYCETYSGNTKIGDTQSSGFTLYVKENDCKPVVSGSVIDTNGSTIALTDDNTKLIRYMSKPRVTVTATPQYSSSIRSYYINLNDGQSSNSSENTFNTINSNSITVSATDSRGYSNSDNIDLTNRMINYIKLEYTNISLYRTEETSNTIKLDLDGKFYNGVFKENGSNNNLTLNWQYKESGASTWETGGTLTPTISDDSFYLYSETLGTNFDYEKEYQFKIVASDLLMTIGNENKDIHIVTKGKAVVEIGDALVNVNGDFTINDVQIQTNASSTVSGGIKIRLSGDTLYITNNGSDA